MAVTGWKLIFKTLLSLRHFYLSDNTVIVQLHISLEWQHLLKRNLIKRWHAEAKQYNASQPERKPDMQIYVVFTLSTLRHTKLNN